jgi:two-component system OmpR family sensor kinase
VTVRLTSDGAAAGGHGAELTITDDGPGIPADVQERVWERFARGDSTRSRGAASTGLGLAIVHAVVTAHGGRPSMASRPGRTAFRIWLPARPPAQLSARPPAQLYARPPASEPDPAD